MSGGGYDMDAPRYSFGALTMLGDGWPNGACSHPAPNDDAERELVERAKRGNAWLVAHGYEPEKTIWDKEESPCL